MGEKAFRKIVSLTGLILVLSLTGCGDNAAYEESMHEEFMESLKNASLGLEQIDEFHEMLQEVQASEEGQIDFEQEDFTQSAELPQEIQEIQELQNTGFLEETYSYAYEQLNEAEQMWYRNIAECLGNMQQDIKLDKQGIELGMDETDIDKVFQCVLMDHPELFYVDGYSYTEYNRSDKVIAIHFSGNYAMTLDRATERKEQIDAAVEPLLEAAVQFTDDYDKVRYVYETVIKNTIYDLESPDNQNIYSVFVNHSSVCQGYAKAVQYLLNRMGVECALVQGTVDTGEGHAWNLVKVNGSYYYVDATWGDASYQPEDAATDGGQVPEISYDYLCVTTQQLLRTHIVEGIVPMPICVDTKDNYYVREGALFTTYDKDQMQALFDKAYAEQRPEVSVKCSDSDCYRQIFTAMTENQEIFDYMKDGSASIVYTHNEKQLSMTFWVTNE